MFNAFIFICLGGYNASEKDKQHWQTLCQSYESQSTKTAATEITLEDVVEDVSSNHAQPDGGRDDATEPLQGTSRHDIAIQEASAYTADTDEEQRNEQHYASKRRRIEQHEDTSYEEHERVEFRRHQ